MTKFIFILCCLFLSIEEENMISWNEAYKLSWQDFKGQPKFEIDAVATTASGITFKYGITHNSSGIVGYNTTVKAHFYPKKSWYKPERASDYILSHEQLHFDITELHARIFRFQIKDLELKINLKEQLEFKHKNIIEALSIMQDKYDTESDFSRNPELQAKWQKYVQAELEKLETYKSIE